MKRKFCDYAMMKDFSSKPVNYKSVTWLALQEQLNDLDESAIRDLAAKVPGANKLQLKSYEDILEFLLGRGGFLLVAFGLVHDPEIMTGTIFSHGGVEFKIDRECAEQIAQDVDPIKVHMLGDKAYRMFSRRALLRALQKSPDFDQLGVLIFARIP